MNATSIEFLPDDACFEWFLDMFFRAESVVFFSAGPDEDEIHITMREMAAGRLELERVHELFDKVRSDSSAVALLASILLESKSTASEAGE